jgi:hypothetical protein
MNRWTIRLALCALTLLAFTSSSHAQLIDPSTLQIGPGNTLDPVRIGSSGFVTVTNVSNGAGNLNVPWLVIIAVPNATTTSATITQVNGSNNAISPNGTTATMGSGQEAYSQLGLDAGTNNSNSFTNWSAADLQYNGINASSFGLFEFNIPVTLSGGGTDTFQFSGLPQGTFIIAYGQTSSHVYNTPFTEAGLTTGDKNPPAPAPPSVVLLGMGAGLFALRAWRRRRSPQASA